MKIYKLLAGNCEHDFILEVCFDNNIFFFKYLYYITRVKFQIKFFNIFSI